MVDNPLRHTGDARLDKDLPSSELSCARASAETEPKASHDGYVVRCDVVETLPVTREEIALLRAFLAVEISAILDSDVDGS